MIRVVDKLGTTKERGKEMTKAEEMKALEKIADIIETCGDDSYVGKAFEGCYLIAKENIENDFWISLKERAELNEKEANKWIDQAKKLDAARDSIARELILSNETVIKERDRANEWVERYKNLEEEHTKLSHERMAQESKIDELKQEIIELKAKLYDLICK